MITGIINHTNIYTYIFLFLFGENSNLLNFLSLNLFIRSMCRGKSAWLPSICRAKFKLLTEGRVQLTRADTALTQGLSSSELQENFYKIAQQFAGPRFKNHKRVSSWPNPCYKHHKRGSSWPQTCNLSQTLHG